MPENSPFADHTAQTLHAIDDGVIPRELHLTIEQRILDGDELVDGYVVMLQNGEALIASDATTPDVVISQDLDTAKAIQAGHTNAQTAYLTGRLTIDGDVDKLLASGPALQAIVEAMGQRAPGDA